MYRALYRKWRPAVFADVVGQANIVEALQNQLLHDKVGHAYMFTGTRGTGKTTCAKIFAKAVNCTGRTGADPCGVCPICLGVDDGSVLDVVEIDAASNNGVDNIRDLRDETAYTPSTATYKVYIIDEVHMLSTAAFNALLKIMEEPPSHVIFILATTEIHKVPATILSRCQRYDFTRIRPQDIAARVQFVAQNEGITLTDDAAGLIARLADGAMRDALSILDTCAGVSMEVDEPLVRRMAGVTDKSYLFSLSDAIARQDAPGALALIADLRERSIDIKRLCDEMILHYRNLLLAGVSGGAHLLTGVSAQEETLYLEAAAHTAQPAAVRAIQTLSAALDKMGKGTDPRIELELAVFTLCSAAPALQNPQSVQGTQSMGYTPAASAPITPSVPVYSQSTVAVQPAPVMAQPVSAPPPAQAVSVSAPSVAAETAATDVPWATDEPAPPAVEQPPVLQTAAPVQPTQQAAPAHAPRPQEEEPPVSAPASAAPMVMPGDVDAPQVFAPWPQVLEAMRKKDGLLYANLNNSKAFYDGKRVLIAGSDLFLEYMRKNEYSAKLIKQTIAEVTGVQCGIGPYRTQEADFPVQDIAQQSFAQLEQMGVPVVYEDE